MHQYKPGTAIGSTGGRGSARNQRERLRTQPPALLDPHLLPNGQQTYMRPSRSVRAASSETSPHSRLTFPEPSELKALDRRDVGSNGSLLHHVVQHAADLFVVVVVVGAHVQLHKHVHAILSHHLPVGGRVKTPGKGTNCGEERKLSLFDPLITH